MRVQALTFARSNVVKVQLVALLGSLQGTLGGKEVAGGFVGLVVSAADLGTNNSSFKCAKLIKWILISSETNPFFHTHLFQQLC